MTHRMDWRSFEVIADRTCDRGPKNSSRNLHIRPSNEAECKTPA
jgi:hypothetical protein